MDLLIASKEKLLHAALQKDSGNILLCNNYLLLALQDEASHALCFSALFFFEQCILYSDFSKWAWRFSKISTRNFPCFKWYFLLCEELGLLSRSLKFFDDALKHAKNKKYHLLFASICPLRAWLSVYLSGDQLSEPWFNNERDVLVTYSHFVKKNALSLVREIKASSVRQYEPTRQSTKKGSVLKISSQTPPTLNNFTDILRGAVYDYSRSLKSNHPILQLADFKDFKLEYWSVSFRKGGYQAPHTHPNGTVSGVCYLQVPEEVPCTSAGCLEIGATPNWLKSIFEVKSIRPEVGMIVLFPSYYYHRTVPTRSSDERISFAFDACPSSSFTHLYER